MKKLPILIFLFLLCAYTSYAQTLTNVSGTITSSDGQTWNNGNITFTFNQNGTTPPYFNDGIPYTPAVIKSNLDALGSFTGVLVPDNKHIVPVNTAWNIQVCPQSNSNCYVLTSPIVITGATMDISMLVVPPAIVVSPIPPASAYQDTEVIATRVGSIYYNLTTIHYRLCTVTINDVCTVWVNVCIEGDNTCGGGSGTVSGTPPFIAKFTTPTSVGNSTCTDDGTNPTRCPNGDNTAAGGLWIERPADTGGSYLGALMCRSNVSLAIICPAGTTTGVLGVAGATVTVGQTVPICFAGTCKPIAFNNTTTGHYLIPSATVAGNVDDTGSATKPAGIQNFLAESSVLAGNATQTTLLAPDTIGSSGGLGTINACIINGVTYYIAGQTLSCLTPPTANGNYVVNYNVTSNVSVPPIASLAGVPINPQVGTTYTKLYSDRLSLDTYTNASPIAVTIPQAGSTGFTSNYADGNWNRGAGLATFTPTASTINGNSSQILPSNWFGFLYSNNLNYFMPVLPTLSAFPNCVDSGGNHLNFTTATGAISCGNSGAGGGITSINTVATGPNVDIVGAGATSVSTTGNTVTIFGGTAGSIAGTWRNVAGSSYTVVDGDNQERLRFGGTTVAITLPQPNTVTTNAFVAQRVQSNAQTLSTFTSANFTTIAGHQLWVAIVGGDTHAVTSVTLNTGDICTKKSETLANRIASLWYCPNLTGSGTTVLTVQTSVAFANATGVFAIELVGTSNDNSATAATSSGLQALFVTNPIHFPDTVSMLVIQNGAANSFPPWIQTDTLGNDNIGATGYRLLTNNSTVTANTASGNAIGQTILSTSSHAAFTAGWYVVLSNVSSTYDVVTSTASTINGQTTLVLAPNQSCGLMSNGANWDSICWTQPNLVNDKVAGQATIVYGRDAAGQTGAIADTGMPMSTVTPMVFRFAGTVNCATSVATATATLNLKWTDTSSTAQTTSVTATCTTLGAASVAHIDQTIRVKSNVAPTWGVTIANAPNYDVSVRLENF